MHIVPRETQRFLKRYGGVNPYGLPKWRLITGADRTIKEGGVWRDWADGLTSAEKGGMNFSPSPDVPGLNFQRYENKPIRIVTEVREHRKYPQSDGWILERWFPATSYGSPDEWYSFKAVDGITPTLGPYPERGDYEFIYGPWLRTPSIDVLERRIGEYTNAHANKRGTPESRLREYSQRWQEKQELEERKRSAEYEALMKDHITPLHSSSLAASRWRQELAARIGVTEHIGII